MMALLLIVVIALTIAIILQHEHGPALIDDMKVELSNMKLSRVLMNAFAEQKSRVATLTGEYSLETLLVCKTPHPIPFSFTDVEFGMEPVAEILLPTSFTLNIKRNLSASWFKEQPDLEVTGKIPVIEVWNS